MHFLYGCKLGGGVLYKILVTVSSADFCLGRSVAGRGGGRDRCDSLYARADVESSIDLGGRVVLAASVREVEDAKRAWLERAA